MFKVENAMRFNNVETVDVEFSAILAEISYTNDVFEPGVTYNDEIEERAGQVYVRKLGKGIVEGGDATAENGLKFNTHETADALIPLLNKYTLSKSELCPEAVDAARKSGKLADKKEVVVRSHGEAWQAQAMALLLGGKNGAETANNFTADADTEAITDTNVVDKILAAQTQIMENDANATVCLVSPEVRAHLLSNYAKGKGFLPETNEEAKRRGIIGDLLGMTVKVTNFIGRASNIAGKIVNGVNNVAKDIKDGAATAKLTDFVVYDPNTYYIDTIFNGMRENDKIEGYFGCSVDIQSVSGAVNTNPERCIAHIHQVATGDTKPSTGNENTQEAA